MSSPGKPTRRRSSSERREATWGFIFIAPWLLGFVWFSLGPILANVYFAFTNFTASKAPEWVGLANFVRLFTQDRLLPQSLMSTLQYVALRVPLWLIVGLLLAVMVNRRLPGIGLMRSILYLPTVLPVVASAVIWLWYLDPQAGFINPFFREQFGIILPNWLNDLRWALPTLVGIGIWQVGQTMMIFLAGLQSIPTELFEAARIDGANAWQRFRGVTLPMLSPTIYFNAVVGTIGAFQVFGAAFILTQGGPVNRTLFYVLLLYRRAFQDVNLGYASAMALVLLAVVLVLTVLLVRSSRNWVTYDRV